MPKTGISSFYKIALFVLLSLSFTLPECYADTYKVIALKNCAPTYSGKPLEIGMLVSNPNLLKENWSKTKGSKYIKLQSQSDKTIHVITEQKKSAQASSNEGFLSSLWNCFTGQKKCSTRAPENELSGGLGNNLSQTFYIVMPLDTPEEPALSFATNLEEGSKLRCTYILNGETYTFVAPLFSNKFVFNYNSFPIPATDSNRMSLRLNVDYISPDGTEVPLTNSMNVILIPE